jgi:hypothetical protein
MKPFLILLALCAGLWAQRVPPCFQVNTVTSATPGTSINNLPWVASNPGCGGYGWKLQWAVTGFTAVTIQIEGSPDNVNWTALPSSQIVSGTNPTTWTGAASPYNIVAFAVNNYMRANVTSVTGTGSVTELLLGYGGAWALQDALSVCLVNPPTKTLVCSGTVGANNGNTTVFRCTTAGTLPVGALTVNSANCGASVDTGFRSN